MEGCSRGDASRAGAPPADMLKSALADVAMVAHFTQMAAGSTCLNQFRCMIVLKTTLFI